MHMGDVRKIAVVVEDEEAARMALRWALHNIVRCGDIITLLHVYPAPTRSVSKSRARLLRLQGFHLALSFQHMCHAFPSVRIGSTMHSFHFIALLFYHSFHFPFSKSTSIFHNLGLILFSG